MRLIARSWERFGLLQKRDLIDGEGDVWACVVRDVGEDADDLAAMPFRFSFEPVFVVGEDGSREDGSSGGRN